MDVKIIIVSLAVFFIFIGWLFLREYKKIQKKEMESLDDEVPKNLKEKPKTDTEIEDKCSVCESKNNCGMVGRSDLCGRE